MKPRRPIREEFRDALVGSIRRYGEQFFGFVMLGGMLCVFAIFIGLTIGLATSAMFSALGAALGWVFARK